MALQRRFFEAPAQSFFLFGPRGTGKSTWLRHTLPDALFLDLLRPDLARELAARPERLRDLVRGAPERRSVVVDEVQRVPELLNVVHALIESPDRRRFVLYGADVFCAIEVKNAARVDPRDVRGLQAFGADYPEAELLLLYRGTARERRGRVWILPVEEFLQALDPARGLPLPR